MVKCKHELILLLKSLEEISIQDESRRSAADLLHIVCWSNSLKSMYERRWSDPDEHEFLGCHALCSVIPKALMPREVRPLHWHSYCHGSYHEFLSFGSLERNWLVSLLPVWVYDLITWCTVTDMWADSRRDDCCWWYAPAQGRDGSTSRRFHRPPRSRLCPWVSTQQLLHRHYTPKYFFLVLKLSWKAVRVFLSLLLRRSIFVVVICRHDL
jgi:hypothetical protein